MKKVGWIILVVVIVFFFPKPYMSSPGFVSPAAFYEFNQEKKECAGFSHLRNPAEVAADAAGKSLCFGWLY